MNDKSETRATEVASPPSPAPQAAHGPLPPAGTRHMPIEELMEIGQRLEAIESCLLKLGARPEWLYHK